MLHFWLALALAIPVHGVALGPGPGHTTIVRLDPVTQMVPAQTRPMTLQPALKLPPGTGVDAFLDRSTQPWRLYDAAIAGRFVAGLPDPGRVDPIDYGSRLPHTQLVDQRGRLVDLSRDFRGKVLLLSFIFTRCPDKNECPALTAKFAALARSLDPKRFHLAEISLDPTYDSPAVLKHYAAQFNADPRMWSFLTGQPHEIAHLLNRFGISSLRVSDAVFQHNDKIFITAPGGKVADILQTLDFDPSGLAAQARSIAGLSSNWFGRLHLALVASAAALCGGSQFAGVVLLETSLFVLIAISSFVTLGWVARKFWWNT